MSGETVIWGANRLMGLASGDSTVFPGSVLEGNYVWVGERGMENGKRGSGCVGPISGG